MRHLLTSLALLATFAAAGQTTNPFPYNPDADADGWISVNDLLSLLSIFTTEFTPESWETDSLSAGVVLNGNLAYFECQNSCHQLEGHWRMADIDAFGRHWGLVSGNSSEFWVNRNSDIEQSQHVLSVNGQTGRLATVDFYTMSYDMKCMCHLQSSPFVPDVLTSETAGLQEQIDSLNAQQTLLTDMLASIDSIQVNSESYGEYSIECVDMGVGPLCDLGSGIADWASLEPIDGYKYPIVKDCSCTVSQDLVDPNWRKFKIYGLSSFSNPELLFFFHRFASGSESAGLYDSLSLVEEEDESYSFYLYGKTYTPYSSGPCSERGGYPSGVDESNAFAIETYNTQFRNLTLWIRDGQNLVNTGLLLSGE